MRCSWKSYELKLNQPFVLSYGKFAMRTAFIFELTDGNHVGLGEGTAITYYGWTEEKIKLELEHFTSIINAGADISTLLEHEKMLPPVRNSLQCAYLDLTARQQGQLISQYLGLVGGPIDLISSITISGETYQELKKQVDQFDWPIYKIKMTSHQDEIKLKLIADHPNKIFRIDANAGWNMNWVSTNASALGSPNIELIEQPFPVDQDELIPRLKALVDKPIFADESCQQLTDMKKCAEYYDGVNIKLMKSGGSDRALEMIKLARKLDMQIMLGCMTETSVGIAHAIQLLELVDLVDVDGSFLIANDPATGSFLEQGKINRVGTTGSGAQLII